MTEPVIRVEWRQLKDFCGKALLAAGVDHSQARDVTDSLIQTSLRGVDSHGIRLLPHYLNALSAGRVNPSAKMTFDQTGPSAGTLDADHAFGHAAGADAMRRAVKMARQNGVACVAVKNSTHFGAAAYFTHLAANEDMIGLAMTHADALMAGAGGARASLGTNPIAFAAPLFNEGPISLDMATSLVNWNKILQMRRQGKTLPPGWAVDEMGREARDPNQARALLPAGSYKGFGLGLMVEIFCSMLTGMPFGRHLIRMYADPIEKKRHLGHFVMAVNIDSFVPLGIFKTRLQEMVDEIRREPPLNPDEPVMAPGDPEKRASDVRRRDGIPLSFSEHEDLVKAGGAMGVLLTASVAA